MVDKYAVKKYVAGKIGEQYIIPTLGVWERFEDIDFSKLPNQFVLKCTHDSGGLVICRDKSKFNMESAQKKITKCLKHNYYYGQREWPYKNVPPRIIAEQYMENLQIAKEMKSCPNEFQFWCFNGVPKFVSAIFQPHGENLKCTYDMNWKRLPFVTSKPIYEFDLDRPADFQMMKSFAEKFCEGQPFVRVDFMIYNSKVYFGELTKFPASALVNWYPSKMDLILGSWIDLPNKEN